MRSILGLYLVAMLIVGCQEAQPARWQNWKCGAAEAAEIKSLANLDVFVIGDSIAGCWAKYAKAKTAPENCKSSRYALRRVDKWQTRRHSIVIFNCGLWDAKQNTPVAEYRDNLRKIIARLQADKVYFCTTTPGRDEVTVVGWESEKINALNEAAIGVCHELNVPIIDLHALCLAHPEWWIPNDVHYFDPGYAAMAREVTRTLQSASH